MKKTVCILIVLVFLLLISFLVGYDHLEGNPENPISYALAEMAAKQYVAKNLPDTAFEISSIGYFDKDEIYYVTLASPGSQDHHFSLGFNHIGTLRRDYYEYYILQKAATAIRISNEYDAAVKNAVSAPPETTKFVCSGRLNWETADASAANPRCIISDELELEGEYPPATFGAHAGHIWFRVNLNSAEEINTERMAEILLYIREKLDAAGIPFHTISASFKCSEPVIVEYLRYLLYEEITPDGLEDRIEKALIS